MNPPRRILVVALDNLGDAVMATAVLRPLKRLFPEASVGMLVKQYAAELLADHSMVDHLHAADPFWDRSPGRPAGSVGDFIDAILGVRAKGYDVALVLNAEWRRALAVRCAGVPVRVGFARRHARPCLTVRVPDAGASVHHVEGHRAILEAFAGDRAAAEEFFPRLEVSESDRSWWEAWSQRTGLAAGSYVVIHPFSGADIRNWPLAAWTSLVERLLPMGHRFVVIASAAEKARLAMAFRALPIDTVHILAGAPLRHAKAVLSRARLFLGGDSGPAHMAAALGVPVVALYRPGTPARSGPVGRGPVHFVAGDPIANIPLADVEAAVRHFFETQREERR